MQGRFCLCEGMYEHNNHDIASHTSLLTSTNELLAFIIRPKPTYGITHLAHECPRNAVKQAPHARRSHRLAQRLNHARIARRLQAHFREIERVRDTGCDTGCDTTQVEWIGFLRLGSGWRDGGRWGAYGEFCLGFVGGHGTRRGRSESLVVAVRNLDRIRKFSYKEGASISSLVSEPRSQAPALCGPLWTTCSSVGRTGFGLYSLLGLEVAWIFGDLWCIFRKRYRFCQVGVPTGVPCCRLADLSTLYIPHSAFLPHAICVIPCLTINSLKITSMPRA